MYDVKPFFAFIRFVDTMSTKVGQRSLDAPPSTRLYVDDANHPNCKFIRER